MNLLLTAFFENGFMEMYLPSVNNKTLPLDIRPHISGWSEDITLPLEVWDEVWRISSCGQFRLTENEKPIDKAELKPGLLLNCEMANSETVFSITVEEAGKGNTHFDKYFLDFASCPSVSIGKEASNVICYDNTFSSPRHAELTVEGGRPVARDLRSVNGTFVNGRLLKETRPLRYGDVIYVVGLKVVYLGNMLAINNPKGKSRVNEQRLAAVNIPSTGEEEEKSGFTSEEKFFLRTPRRLALLDEETFTIEKCPPKNQQKRQPIIFTIGPAFSMMIPMVAGTMMMGGGSLAGGLVMSVGAALIGVVWALLNIRYQKQEEMATEQERVDSYTAYITKIAQKLRQKVESNRAALSQMLPSAKEVVSFALEGNARLWEKSAGHEDFLAVRFGLGDIPSPNKVVVPKEQMMTVHDPLNDKVEEIQETMSMLRSVPVDLSLYANRMVGIVSRDRERAVGLTNLVSVQLAGLHSYTEVRLAYVYPMRENDAWEYARWLPHIWSPDGKLRMVGNDKNTLGDVMYHLTGIIRDRLEKKPEAENARVLPHYVVTIADWSLIEGEPIAKYLMNPVPELGITVIYVVDSLDKLPSGCTAIVQDDEENRGFYSTAGVFPPRSNVRFDDVSLEKTAGFARALSNYHVREMNVSTTIPDVLTFLDMYKTSKVEDLDMLHKWLANRTYESMRSLIGYKSGSQPLYLDIHEKYHGPHGLVAGTTGSGKSETLQSYILSLAINYHPHEVAFILIDYKGGGMAQSFLGLPHLSGVITNLGGNATNRALLSINAEIKNRQRIFNEYKVKHIDAYIELYRSGAAAEPMPHLLIIADEFAELKKEQPEFVRALVSAARVGRSLGVNLILATQKPSGVVDDEIWSNTRFRLCLRVADKQDSNEMLKRPDAAFITGTGRGYFQVGSDEIFEEFQSGWSGAEYEPHLPFVDDKNVKVELINLIGKSGVPKQKKQKKSDNIAKITQLDAVVRQAASIAQESGIPAIKQIWLPPLPGTVYLDSLPPIERPAGFSLLLPVGLADDPDNQRQFSAAVDLLTDGHLLVCGAGGSGKTTFLQTLIYSAVTLYTPQEVNIYIADFSSRTMAVFAGLPHVGGVFFEGDDEKIGELFALLRTALARRKSEFSKQGIGSFREYVAQCSDCPAIVFLLDGYEAFAESYGQYEDDLSQLSREAASYGIYLVLAAGNSGALRSRLRQNFASGVGLQMPDRFEYEAVVGQRTEIVPESRTPGRGLMKAPLPVEFQTALCVRESAGLSQAQILRRRFAEMSSVTSGGALKIGDKLEGVSYEELSATGSVKALPENLLAVGLSAEGGAVVALDLDEEFCYSVSGAGQTGKSNFLAAVAKQAKAKGAAVYLFGAPDGLLAAKVPFDKVISGQAALFDFFEQALVPEFSRRNALVNEARDAGAKARDALSAEKRIIFLIDDMSGFMNAVYSPDMDMSGFFELALAKGKEHKIQFFAAITPDDGSDLARYAAMRLYTDAGRGLHLGGLFDQQSILSFDLSAADRVRDLPPGTAYAAGTDGRICKVITPYVEEVDGRE